MKRLVFLIYRGILSLRYRVTVKNKKVLKNNKTKLILPNHQAHADHQILLSILIPLMKVAPIVAGRFAKNWLTGMFIRWVNGIPVTDIKAGEMETFSIEEVEEKTHAYIHRGYHILLYPSGQLSAQGKEKILGKKLAHTFTKSMCGTCQVVAVKISGLWGSRSSKAWTGDIPKAIPFFLRGIFLFLANLIFFMPRRKVTVEFIDITEQATAFSAKPLNEFNAFLENIYNQSGEEEVKFLKYHFLYPRLKRVLPLVIADSEKQLQEVTKFEEKDFSPELVSQINTIVSRNLIDASQKVEIGDHLNFDLHIDSLGLVTILEEIEQEFPGVPETDIRNLKTVGDLYAMVSGKFSIAEKLKESKLHQPVKNNKALAVDPEKDVVYNFLKTFTADPKANFAWDKLLGNLTRKEFLLKASVVSLIVKKEVKGQYVGVMLPALQSSALLVASCYLAGKTPVMFNWTTGPANMEHCLDQVDTEIILTAGSFYEKIEEVLPQKIKERCVFFEKKVRETKLGTKLKGLFLSKMPKKAFKPFHVDDTAVVLFTSGSESRPKAVPLSHKNLVADTDGVYKILTLDNNDVILSFLPPFHSFGFTVMIIIPLISGLKPAYSPNPTDRFEIQRVTRHTKPTLLVGAPTFLKMFLNVFTREDFDSFRLVISGAEALPQSLIDRFHAVAQRDIPVLEGYGITECAPILSLNPLGKQKLNSVGLPIGGLDCIITDIDTNELKQPGEEGMIMVSGNNVFSGYPDKNIENPFVIINNKTYYRTGDLGFLDAEGYLFITGRLKRFVKIGGEMISLPAIEKELLHKYGSDEEIVLAVEGDDKSETPEIVVFSVLDLKVDEMNKLLMAKGFSSLVKINRIIRIEEIPLLGTGKTDYQVLKKQLTK